MAQNWKKKIHDIHRTTIHTGGKKVDGLHFMGETMICAICHKQQQSDPKVESGWTILQLDESSFYVCPDHFPSGEATSQQYADAYYAVMRKLIQLRQQ